MEKEIIIKATVNIEAFDQEGKKVDVVVKKLVINEIIFDKITVNGVVTSVE